jgi:hypothetical protein
LLNLDSGWIVVCGKSGLGIQRKQKIPGASLPRGSLVSDIAKSKIAERFLRSGTAKSAVPPVGMKI